MSDKFSTYSEMFIPPPKWFYEKDIHLQRDDPFSSLYVPQTDDQWQYQTSESNNTVLISMMGSMYKEKNKYNTMLKCENFFSFLLKYAQHMFLLT